MTTPKSFLQKLLDEAASPAQRSYEAGEIVLFRSPENTSFTIEKILTIGDNVVQFYGREPFHCINQTAQQYLQQRANHPPAAVSMILELMFTMRGPIGPVLFEKVHLLERLRNDENGRQEDFRKRWMELMTGTSGGQEVPLQQTGDHILDQLRANLFNLDSRQQKISGDPATPYGDLFSRILRKEVKQDEELTPDQIKQLVSEQTGIPVDQILMINMDELGKNPCEDFAGDIKGMRRLSAPFENHSIEAIRDIIDQTLGYDPEKYDPTQARDMAIARANEVRKFLLDEPAFGATGKWFRPGISDTYAIRGSIKEKASYDPSCDYTAVANYSGVFVQRGQVSSEFLFPTQELAQAFIEIMSLQQLDLLFFGYTNEKQADEEPKFVRFQDRKADYVGEVGTPERAAYEVDLQKDADDYAQHLQDITQKGVCFTTLSQREEGDGKFFQIVRVDERNIFFAEADGRGSSSIAIDRYHDLVRNKRWIITYMPAKPILISSKEDYHAIMGKPPVPKFDELFPETKANVDQAMPYVAGEEVVDMRPKTIYVNGHCEVVDGFTLKPVKLSEVVFSWKNVQGRDMYIDATIAPVTHYGLNQVPSKFWLYNLPDTEGTLTIRAKGYRTFHETGNPRTLFAEDTIQLYRKGEYGPLQAGELLQAPDQQIMCTAYREGSILKLSSGVLYPIISVTNSHVTYQSRAGHKYAKTRYFFEDKLKSGLWTIHQY